VNNSTLIYDGDCSFCKGWVEWARKRDAEQKLEFITCQSDERKQRFPQIQEADCLKGMYVVLPDGRFFWGADALSYFLGAVSGWRWSAGLFRIPGALFIARPIYRLIARNRHKMGCNTSRTCPAP